MCEVYALDVIALVKLFDVFTQSVSAQEHPQALNDLEKALNHVLAERNQPKKHKATEHALIIEREE